jgi:hypothetical protein
MPGDFRCYRCEYSCASALPLRTRGCGCTGHPAFPTPSSRAKVFAKTRARSAPRERERMFNRHCERSEAIHRAASKKAGLLRGACHRARIRATRWLAMTIGKTGAPHFQSSSLRKQGPITTGVRCCTKAVEQRLSRQTSRRMGPRFRGDDGLRLLPQRSPHNSLALENTNELTRRVFSSRISVRVIGGSARWLQFSRSQSRQLTPIGVPSVFSRSIPAA